MTGYTRMTSFVSDCAQMSRTTIAYEFAKKFQQDERGIATIDFAIVVAIASVLGSGMSVAVTTGARDFATQMEIALTPTQRSVEIIDGRYVYYSGSISGDNGYADVWQ